VTFDAVDRYICEHGQEYDPDPAPDPDFGELVPCPMADQCVECHSACEVCGAEPAHVKTGCWYCKQCVEDQLNCKADRVGDMECQTKNQVANS
jgi:hypothetical protein